MYKLNITINQKRMEEDDDHSIFWLLLHEDTCVVSAIHFDNFLPEKEQTKSEEVLGPMSYKVENSY